MAHRRHRRSLIFISCGTYIAASRSRQRGWHRALWRPHQHLSSSARQRGGVGISVIAKWYIVAHRDRRGASALIAHRGARRKLGVA